MRRPTGRILEKGGLHRTAGHRNPAIFISSNRRNYDLGQKVAMESERPNAHEIGPVRTTPETARRIERAYREGSRDSIRAGASIGRFAKAETTLPKREKSARRKATKATPQRKAMPSVAAM